MAGFRSAATRTMKLSRTEAVLEYSSYENARRQLAEAADEVLGRPLACWAHPSDRALPIALIDRPIREVLDMGFERLRSTPGVGHKKLQMLVELLSRVAAESGTVAGLDAFPMVDARPTADAALAIDSRAVSEVSWSLWRAAVTNHRLESKPLGLLADSLRNLPRPVWDTPLGVYTPLTLAEIRKLKTHGRKRVNAILEVFRAVYTMLSTRKADEHLVVNIRPQNIDRLETRVMMLLERQEAPTRDEVRRFLLPAMIEQVRIDGSSRLVKLVEMRFGVDARWRGVAEAARQLGITRARVYQHIQELTDIMRVRWPEGYTRMRELSMLFQASGIDPEEIGMFDAAVELFFSGRNESVLAPVFTGPVRTPEAADVAD